MKDFDLLDAYDSILTIEGGMSYIKVCNSKIDKEIVAVKIPKEISLKNNELRALWLFESRNWLDVGYHQNILGFRRLHFAGGMPHLVFDFVDNNLRKNINSLNLKEIIKISTGICDALIHFQSRLKSFTHNDLKPENILLDKDKNPILADLGVSFSAKNMSLLENDYKLYYDVNLKFTTSLKYGGTEYYKSPEQKKYGEISILSDIYAFGLILYEMLTGKLYYNDNSKLNIHFVENRIEITKNQFDNLQTIINNCVKAEPKDRIQTFDEIAQNLRTIYFESYNTVISSPLKQQNNEDKIFGYIDSLIKFGEFNDAINLINELKDECSIYFLKSKIYNKQKNYLQAIEYANLGIQKIPTDKEQTHKIILLEQLANGYSGNKQYDISISIRNEIAKLSPKLGGNYFNIGRDYALKGDLTNSEYFLKKSISVSADIRTYDLLIRILSTLEKYSEILSIIDEIEELYIENPIYFRLRAETFFMIAGKEIMKNKALTETAKLYFIESRKSYNKLTIIGQLTKEDDEILKNINTVLK